MKDQNIVLIGMSGCGKTTVGRAVAQSLGLRFVDVDKEVEQASGSSISRIFKQWGEARFRSLEAAACLAAAKQTGAVIATGGGAVLNEASMRALKKSGLTVFIRRDIEDILATANAAVRPLFTDEADVRGLYEARLPMYMCYADVIIENSDAAECANALIRLWKERL